MAFPLPVASTISRRSEGSAAVQLCDLVAGLSAKVFARQVQSDAELAGALATGRFSQIAANGVAPGTEFPDGPPPLRTGKDAVDRMVDIIRSGGGVS